MLLVSQQNGTCVSHRIIHPRFCVCPSKHFPSPYICHLCVAFLTVPGKPTLTLPSFIMTLNLHFKNPAVCFLGLYSFTLIISYLFGFDSESF